MDEVHERRPVPALRLIFEYDGDEVRLVSQHPVDMVVPGVDLAQVPHPGHYVETRSAEDVPLARVPVREAFATSAEVFPERPGEPITRVDLPQAKGAFTVVVPAGAQAARVALLQVRAPEELKAARAGTRATTPTAGEPEVVEMATFTLAANPARAEGDG
jgi:hypothetical protein